MTTKDRFITELERTLSEESPANSPVNFHNCDSLISYAAEGTPNTHCSCDESPFLSEIIRYVDSETSIPHKHGHVMLNGAGDAENTLSTDRQNDETGGDGDCPYRPRPHLLHRWWRNQPGKLCQPFCLQDSLMTADLSDTLTSEISSVEVTDSLIDGESTINCSELATASTVTLLRQRGFLPDPITADLSALSNACRTLTLSDCSENINSPVVKSVLDSATPYASAESAGVSHLSGGVDSTSDSSTDDSGAFVSALDLNSFQRNHDPKSMSRISVHTSQNDHTDTSKKKHSQESTNERTLVSEEQCYSKVDTSLGTDNVIYSSSATKQSESISGVTRSLSSTVATQFKVSDDMAAFADWSQRQLETLAHLEIDLRAEFANLDNQQRSCFNYLLLDPFLTPNIPASISDGRALMAFASSIFYVGKGQQQRSYCHLLEAIDTNTSVDKMRSAGVVNSPVSAKIGRIRAIWRAGGGVVPVHVFHHCCAAESLARESLMLSVLNVQYLTNVRRGTSLRRLVVANGGGSCRRKRWTPGELRRLGVWLVYKAMRHFQLEGEIQLRPDDVARPQTNHV